MSACETNMFKFFLSEEMLIQRVQQCTAATEVSNSAAGETV